MTFETKHQQNDSPTRMRPIIAWKALRRLIADPEQTEEVFTVIRALSGSSLRRGLARFRNNDKTRALLNAEPGVGELLHVLSDRDRLAQLPADSFGRTYLNFVTSEGISADGLVEASAEGTYANMNPDLVLYSTRLRDQHDLWHTLTRYGRDELGEVCLLGFTYAQTRNRGVAAICLMGSFNLSKRLGFGVFRAVFRGYLDGRKASWLPGQVWEELLPLPVDEVRAQLNIAEPLPYQQLSLASAA